jgi:hypothetical protein
MTLADNISIDSGLGVVFLILGVLLIICALVWLVKRAG